MLVRTGTLNLLVFGDYQDLINNFFFFQAEDGIRDRDVTGVQTCALPISRPNDRSARFQNQSPRGFVVWDSQSHQLRIVCDLRGEAASCRHDQRQRSGPEPTRKCRRLLVNLSYSLRFGEGAHENWERAFDAFFSFDKSINRIRVEWIAAESIDSVGRVGDEPSF